MSTDALPELPQVSLVCVETRRHGLAIAAMQRCMRQARFAHCLLLSTGAPDLPAGIRHVPIAPLGSIQAYSEFMLRGFGDCFDTAHALVVQWDGFVLDGACWDPAFLDYDYIGAPWNDPQRRVGNGGFSLRSRRLCAALRELVPAAPHPEDVCICMELRPQLEARGIRFAPTAVAERFAFEEPRPAFPTFGFHGVFNFHRALPEAELVAFVRDCDDAIVRSRHGRRLLKRCHAAGLAEAARILHARRMDGPPAMRVDALKLAALARLRRLAGRG